VQKAAVKFAADADAFAEAVTTFYAGHAALVAEALQMPSTAASEYCAGQAAQLLGEAGIRALDTWAAAAYAEGLAEWALETEAA
jgi:hypothetical protein